MSQATIWQVRAKRVKWALKKRIILESMQAVKDPYRTFLPMEAVTQLQAIADKIAALQAEIMEDAK